jgi:hypothetical protein
VAAVVRAVVRLVDLVQLVDQVSLFFDTLLPLP